VGNACHDNYDTDTLGDRNFHRYTGKRDIQMQQFYSFLNDVVLFAHESFGDNDPHALTAPAAG